MADATIVGLDPFKPACPQCSWIDTNLGRQLDKLCALHQGVEDLRSDLLLERQINRSTSSTFADLSKVLGAAEDDDLVEVAKARMGEIEELEAATDPEAQAHGIGESPIERMFVTACLLVNMTTAPAFNFGFGPDGYYAYVFPQEHIDSYRVDFLILGTGLFNDVKIVVECDGHEFHERTPAQASRDRQRDRRLQGLGYHIMRFTGAELFNNSFSCACEVAILLIDKAGVRAKPLTSYQVQRMADAIAWAAPRRSAEISRGVND